MHIASKCERLFEPKGEFAQEHLRIRHVHGIETTASYI